MRSVLAFSFLAFCFVGNGQIINFPDPNFKNTLVNTICADTDGNGSLDNDVDLNNDGEIDVSEALMAKSINVGNQNITSIEGINYFQSIISLDCSHNNISDLNLENLPLLGSLSCQNNSSLKTLKCTNLPTLFNLYCRTTGLISLELKDLPSLLSLDCSWNSSLNNLTLTNLPRLSQLFCNNSGIISLALKDLPSLLTIQCGSNTSLTSLTLSNLSKLLNLNCSFSRLISLDLKNLPSLLTLNCSSNITLINLLLTNLPKLTELDCRFSGLVSLHLKDLPSVNLLFCDSNDSLKTLTLTNLPKLSEIYCSSSKLINLDLRDLPVLSSLDCSYNRSLNSLTLTNLPKLYKLYYTGTNLRTLFLKDLPLLTFNRNSLDVLNTLTIINLPKLKTLDCSSLELITLELKDLHSLSALDCSYNNSLISLTLKNLPNLSELNCSHGALVSLDIKGPKINQQFLSFHNNPNLEYICCNENNISEIKNMSISNGQNCEVNSYCTFTPGGKFYLINGENKYDENLNGCENQDIKVPNIKYYITKGSISGFFVSNSTGKYSIPVQNGIHTITPILEHPNHFEVTPSTYTITFPSTSDTITQNFCITPKNIFRQTNITVIPLTPPARPGFEAQYKIVWENAGNQIESGTLNFTYDETLLDYISATQTADQVADGIIKWNFNNLLPFEKREITVTLKVNRPTDTPAVNAGDKIYLTASILDNIFTLENTVVGSYDPNDKTCLQGDRVKPDMVGEYVDYLIRFENTGNFAAENVVVKDIIDTKTFDISTLKITDASHEVYTRIEGNKVEFIFENIQLPFDDANNDGYIAFKIKTLPSLVLSDSLKNLADIYFDYNFPIRTNEAQTTVAFPVFTKDITTEVNVYPNPVSDNLYLDTNENWTKAEIFDIAGRIMRSISLDSSSMDVSGLESGTYFIRLKDGEKVGLVKFVKM